MRRFKFGVGFTVNLWVKLMQIALRVFFVELPFQLPLIDLVIRAPGLYKDISDDPAQRPDIRVEICFRSFFPCWGFSVLNMKPGKLPKA